MPSATSPRAARLPPTLDDFCHLSSRRCTGARESRCGSIRRWGANQPAAPGPCSSCSATVRRATRSELAVATGLGRSTVAQRIDTLVASKLVGAAGEATSSGGRPPARFAFNPRARLVLGVDVGATHVRLAVTDLAANVLADEVVDLDVAVGPEKVLTWVVDRSRVLVRRAGRRLGDVVGVGIGLPGPVEFATGRPTSPPIMPGWDGFDVAGIRAPVAARRRRRRQRRQRDGPRRTLPGLPGRRPPDVRQGGDRDRLWDHPRRGAVPRRQGSRRRPRPRAGARRRVGGVPVRQRRLPRGGGVRGRRRSRAERAGDRDADRAATSSPWRGPVRRRRSA